MLDQPGIFTYRDGVAVIQLFFFSIYLIFGFVLCWRHGFRRSEGWVILVTFSTLRILAASFQLASINYPTDSVYGGALICQGIGLAPLTLLNLGLFVRLNKFTNTIHPKIFTFISILAIAGIALAIYGGTESADSPTLSSNALLKASVLLFVACYLSFFLLFLLFLRQRHSIPYGEQRLLVCFGCCVPFMVIRILFGILGTWVDGLRDRFGVLSGNVTIFLFMAVLEEIFIVAGFVFTGMGLEKLKGGLRSGSDGGGGGKNRDLEGAVELRSRE